MTGKYIIIEADGLEVAIIFPTVIQHAQAVNRNAGSVCFAPVLSAGFFEVTEDGRIETSGESKSLGLRPRPGDAEIIRESLFLTGLKNFCLREVGVLPI